LLWWSREQRDGVGDSRQDQQRIQADGVSTGDIGVQAVTN
jgi:hypothetical protein